MRMVCSVVVTFASALAWGQATVAPKANSQLRKDVLAGLRVPVENALKQRVKFVVDHMRVQGNWAFMTGKTQTPAGKPIDYRRTKYRSQVEAGVFDDWICALLQKKGKKWQVAQFVIGATDVAWDGWDKTFKAPRAIFPYPKR